MQPFILGLYLGLALGVGGTLAVIEYEKSRQRQAEHSERLYMLEQRARADVLERELERRKDELAEDLLKDDPTPTPAQ